MDLVLFGIQGSGKGTQARKLCEEFGYDQFEAGGELRKMAASGTELGNTVKEYIDSGEHVPSEIIVKVLREAVNARPADQKILFDGIPRNPEQKGQFDDIMHEANREFQCIELHVDEEEAIKRILERAEKEGRSDDADEQAVRRRMELFHEKTEPVIHAYRDEGKVTDVDGEGEINDVYERMKRALSIA